MGAVLRDLCQDGSSKDGLAQLIAELLDATVERHGVATTIVGPGYVLDVHRNERVLAPAHPQAYDFVEWPYYLEIDAEAEQTRHAQIAVITRLLIGPWEAGRGCGGALVVRGCSLGGQWWA
jgi:hypothetical protein